MALCARSRLTRSALRVVLAGSPKRQIDIAPSRKACTPVCGNKRGGSVFAYEPRSNRLNGSTLDRKGREIMMESEASRHAEENKKLVGNNIAALRKKQKLTKGFLYDMATISKPTLNGIESGKGNATISTLTKVADALGVTVGDLFNPLSDK